jgi:chromosome segregation ATPase
MGQPDETPNGSLADIGGEPAEADLSAQHEDLAVGDGTVQSLFELAGDTTDLVVSSAELRQQIAELNATLPELRDAVAQTGLAAYGSPKDRKLSKAAEAALKALRDADDRLAQLTAAAELVERQEQAAREALEAEKVTAERERRNRCLREKLRIAEARLNREAKDQEADCAKIEQHEMDADSCEYLIGEALQKIAEYRAELAKIPLHVEVLNDRILSRDQRIAALIDEVDALNFELTNGYPKPVEPEPEPVEPAEPEPDPEAEEIARRVAELEEQSARELRRREAEYQSEHVEVDVSFIEIDGVVKHHGGTRRMQRRYVAQHEAEMAALAARLGQRPVQQRPVKPWLPLQGPPHSLGLEAAIKSWLRTADPVDIKFAYAAAHERGDKTVVELLGCSI